METINLGDKFVNRIKTRLNILNKNWLSIICGETGSGKSYSALSLANFIGPMHLVFNPVEFLSLLTSKKIKRGHVIIFDEAGVGMSSREWYSMQNKLLGSVLQTFRNMNCAVIFTCPNLSFIDVQARKLFHNYIETSYLDYDKELSILKVYDIDVNSRLDKVYYKKPIFVDKEGHTYKMGQLTLPKPDKETVEYYEERKQAYTEKLNQRAFDEMTGANLPTKKPEVDLKRIAELVKSTDKNSSIDRIAAKFELSTYKARIVKNLAAL